MSDGLHIANRLFLPIDAVTETFAFLGRRGNGKALALDTPLPTPHGWTTMGNVRVGDELFDEKGQACRVMVVHPVMLGNDCYRIRFSDGTSIVADAEHLWLTENKASRKSDMEARGHDQRGRGGRSQCERKNYPGLVTTREMADTLMHGKERNHAIRTCSEIRCRTIDLPLDPYVLGLWLGDGTSAENMITTADSEVIDYAMAVGYETWPIPSQRQPGCDTYRITGGNPPFRATLRSLGLLGNKHIPPSYLRASVEQREQLLAGLMDSDGTVARRAASCIFTNKNAKLAHGVYELVCSLGWKATKRNRPTVLRGRFCGTGFEVQFRPTRQVFRLQRKAHRLEKNLDVSQRSRVSRRFVVSVDSVPSVPVRCIAVDSESRLFLASESFIPTHNTYAAIVLAEQMLDAGAQIVVLDPVGVWWGLRLMADGVTPGYPIPVFGGLHGDIPLEPTAGALIADVVCDRGISAVIDVSQMISAEQAKFARHFATRFFQRKKALPSAVHLFIEEAQEFVPQNIGPGGGDAAHMLHAFERLIKLGRNFGVGVSLISQRPQEVNKKALNQTECLFAFQMTGTHERKAIKEWTSAQGIEDQDVMQLLPTLKRGEPICWSPQWLEISRVVEIRKKKTLDVSATPKVGAKAVEVKDLAAVDLQKLHDDMAATIERAKDRDPKELRKEVARLRRELAQQATPEPTIERVETSVLKDEHVEELRTAVEEMAHSVDLFRNECDPILLVGKQIIQALDNGRAVARPRAPRPVPAAPPNRTRLPQPEPSGDMTGPEQRILDAIAWMEGIGVDEPNQVAVAFLAGYKYGAGGYNNPRGRLNKTGMVAYRPGNKIVLTEAGRAAANSPDALLSTEDLHERVLERLPNPEQRLLRPLLETYPEMMSNEDLAHRAGYVPATGGYNNPRGRLRGLGLVSYPKSGYVVAEPLLFLEDARRGV